MTLLETIDRDMKEAMRAKNADKLSVLRFLKSAVKYVAIDKPGAMGDAEVTQVIQKQIKQRRESIQQFLTGGRKDLATKEESELKILEAYLPQQISGAELQKIIEDEARAQGAVAKKDFGRMMKHLNEKLAGAADNKKISELLGQILK